jgi:hypothetical protein
MAILQQQLCPAATCPSAEEHYLLPEMLQSLHERITMVDQSTHETQVESAAELSDRGEKISPQSNVPELDQSRPVPARQLKCANHFYGELNNSIVGCAVTMQPLSSRTIHFFIVHVEH